MTEGKLSAEAEDLAATPPELRDTWDGRSRRWVQRYLPWRRLLPDTEPGYVRSLLYVFGVVNLSSLAMLLVSGIVLAFLGPAWWNATAVGRFVDAVHYWSVQVFFMGMFVHFTGVYLMGAFRGRRAWTWMLGVLAFLFAATTGLTGYVSARNFDAQWISTQAKDAVNATGLGGIVNLLDPGQTTAIHMLVLPLAVVGVVAVHVLLVRVRGVAPPYDAKDEHLGPEAG